MFGISGAEFLIILVVVVAVIPAKHWPEVAKFLARVVKFVRDLVWKISDNVEQIKDQIELEKPITDLAQSTMDDVMSAFAAPRKSRPKAAVKKRRDRIAQGAARNSKGSGK